MNRMLGTCVAGLLALAALPTTARAADCAVKPPADLVTAGSLVFGTTLSTPPQAYLDNNEASGLDVEVAKAVAAQLCLKPEFVNLAFPGLFPGLNAKKFDAVIVGVGITPERQEVFDFVPYFQGGIRFVVQKSSGLSFKDESELCGHSVATVTGSVEARALDRANQENCTQGKKIEIKVYPSFNEAVQQLRKSVVDIAFVDWPFAAYLVNLMPELVVGSPILSGTPGRPRNREGIVVRKGDTTMKSAIEQAFLKVQASGEYDKIMDKWHLKEGDIRLVSH